MNAAIVIYDGRGRHGGHVRQRIVEDGARWILEVDHRVDHHRRVRFRVRRPSRREER